MTVFAQNSWADVFNSEDHRQAQQQTAYLLLKGKAEEQLGLSEEIVEGRLATIDALKRVISRDDLPTLRSLLALARSQAQAEARSLDELAAHIIGMEKACG